MMNALAEFFAHAIKRSKNAIGLFGIIILWRCLVGMPAERRACLHDKSLSYYGTISSIVKDEENPKESFVILDNGDTIMPQYTYGLWIATKVNDTIVKNSGELRYYIHRYQSEEIDTVDGWGDCEDY